jgi:type VI secretion system protein VasJ
MLGSIEEASKPWQWAASGKHPVARDYFRIGLREPMFEAFSDWIEKGFQRVGRQDKVPFEPCSWRFWAKGLKKGTLVCGLAKGSSDSVGRRYPLLILGTGFLADWAAHWESLPSACEHTWVQMEYLSAKRFEDLKQFEEGIRVIRPPSMIQSDVFLEKEDTKGKSPLRPETMSKAGLDGPDFFTSLDGGETPNSQRAVQSWHHVLRQNNADVPNAVFIGGTSKESYLAVFRRALVPDDFVRLWSEDILVGEKWN